jgi:hypothetical protein
MRWTTLLLVFLPSQQDPTQKLVDQLGADSVEVREKAAAELLKLGEKAEKCLREAAEHPDAEVRARARDLSPILARITFSEGFLRGRGSSKPDRLAEAGGGQDTEDAVLAALRWLARHQNEDGSWGVTRYTRRCTKACLPNPGRENFEVGVTGLALLAFLGAGHSNLSEATHDGISFGNVVRKGVQWVLARQDEEGCIGGRTAQKYMYAHTICTLALVEAYGLTKLDSLKGPAQKASDFTVAAQNPGKVWRYSYKCGDNDTSVTMWAALALRGAWHQRLEVPERVFEETRAWLNELTDESYCRVGYTHKGGKGCFIPGPNETYDHHEGLTAGAALLRILLGESRESPVVRGGVELCLRDLPQWEPEQSVDYYYWHFGTLALFQHDGPRSARWRCWNERLKETLVKNQWGADQGCKGGSWEPTDRWSSEAGRVYATAMNALTLETYYRYALVPRE